MKKRWYRHLRLTLQRTALTHPKHLCRFDIHSTVIQSHTLLTWVRNTRGMTHPLLTSSCCCLAVYQRHSSIHYGPYLLTTSTSQTLMGPNPHFTRSNASVCFASRRVRSVDHRLRHWSSFSSTSIVNRYRCNPYLHNVSFSSTPC